MTTKKIGIVLSGGGARGFAHLGILKYIEELGISPQAVAGTSAGAIAGAMYASGMDPESICTAMKSNSYFTWSNFNGRLKSTPGLFRTDQMRKLLLEHLGTKTFSDLKRELHVVSTDINEGTEVCFSEGNVVDAVVASASIPVVYNPSTMEEKILVDGGLLNNFPVEPLVGSCDIIIGSYVNKLDKGVGNYSSWQIINMLDRCFHLAISQSVYAKTHHCHVFIETSLHNYNMFDTQSADEIFEIGYTTAKTYRESLLAVL